MPSIDFCREIAEKITGAHNQHATLMITAPKGKGKSWAAMAICQLIAEYVAEIRGGTPPDYFSADNIGIITQDEVIRILKTKLGIRYGCIDLDDIGVGWNSRDFMTDFNKSMNDLWQTFRTRNVFVVVTLPDPMLIDLVPRDMVQYVMEIDESNFDLGYVTAKLFEVTKKMRQGKKLYPYLHDLKGNRVVRHLIFAPTDDMIAAYEPRRSKIEKDNSTATISALEEFLAKQKDAGKPKESAAQARASVAEAIAAEFGTTKKRACEVAGIPYNTLRRLEQSNRQDANNAT